MLPTSYIGFLHKNKMLGVVQERLFFDCQKHLSEGSCSYIRPIDLIIYHFQEILPIKPPSFHHRSARITSKGSKHRHKSPAALISYGF